MNNDIADILSHDFDWWSLVKERRQAQKSEVLFKNGEIWWCHVGLNLGEEIFGKGLEFRRPVLVFRKLTSNSFTGLPLTSQEKKGSWYVETILHGKKRFVMLNQSRMFDRKRLTNRIGTLDDTQYMEVKRRFLEFYSS